MEFTDEERRRFAEIAAALERDQRQGRRRAIVRTAPQVAAIVCFALSFLVLQPFFILLTWVLLVISIGVRMRTSGRPIR